MIRRPHDFVHPAPGTAATFTAPRLRTTSKRNRLARRALRQKLRATEPSRNSALSRQWYRDTEAAFSKALEPFGLPVPLARSGSARWPLQESATGVTMRQAGRQVIFGLVVALMHLAALQWIFLRIGG